MKFLKSPLIMSEAKFLKIKKAYSALTEEEKVRGLKESGWTTTPNNADWYMMRDCLKKLKVKV